MRINIYVILLLGLLLTFSGCSSKEERLQQQVDEFIERSLGKNADFDRIHKDLQNWLLTDPDTHGFFSEKLTEYLDVRHVSSPDGKISINAWYVEPYKTMNVIQIMGENGFRTYDYGVIQLNNKTPKDGVDYSTEIQQIQDKNGETVYLIKTVGGANSFYDNERTEWAAFHIRGNELVPVKNFFKGTHADNGGSLVYMCYNQYNWNLRTEKSIQAMIPFSFETSNRIIRIPVIDVEERALDHYFEYRFNGTNFVLADKAENPTLHRSLKGYQELVQLYETERHYIRIDLMPDETYRYAAWHKNNIEHKEIYPGVKPDIIVTQGYLNNDTHQYIFINGSYTYKIPVVREIYENGEEEGTPYLPYIDIEYKGKTNTRQEIYY